MAEAGIQGRCRCVPDRAKENDWFRIQHVSKRKKSGRITKNLTFAPAVDAKAQEIQRESGEEWAVMCARLINEEYNRKFPCTCRKPPDPTRRPKPAKAGRSLVADETPPSPFGRRKNQEPEDGKSGPSIIDS